MTFLAPWEIKCKPRINLNHNIIHVTLLKLLLHIQYPQLLPISLTILETKLQTSLEFVFFVLHTNGVSPLGNISDKMAFWGRCTVSSLGVGRSKETERNLVRISIKNREMNECTAVGGLSQRTTESNISWYQS